MTWRAVYANPYCAAPVPRSPPPRKDLLAAYGAGGFGAGPDGVGPAPATKVGLACIAGDVIPTHFVASSSTRILTLVSESFGIL